MMLLALNIKLLGIGCYKYKRTRNDEKNQRKNTDSDSILEFTRRIYF